jgi:hypothetical protein
MSHDTRIANDSGLRTQSLQCDDPSLIELSHHQTRLDDGMAPERKERPVSTKPISIEVRAAKIDDEVSEGDNWERIQGLIFHDIAPQVTVTIAGVPRPLLEWQELAEKDES